MQISGMNVWELNRVRFLQVLAIFKQLHVTRQKLYKGDEPNLAKARAKINEEFKKHKIVKSEDEIPELIDVAKQVEHFYRTQVVQAVQVDKGKHSTLSGFCDSSSFVWKTIIFK